MTTASLKQTSNNVVTASANWTNSTRCSLANEGTAGVSESFAQYRKL
jgi:hypothetical protein